MNKPDKETLIKELAIEYLLIKRNSAIGYMAVGIVAVLGALGISLFTLFGSLEDNEIRHKREVADAELANIAKIHDSSRIILAGSITESNAIVQIKRKIDNILDSINRHTRNKLVCYMHPASGGIFTFKFRSSAENMILLIHGTATDNKLGTLHLNILLDGVPQPQVLQGRWDSPIGHLMLTPAIISVKGKIGTEHTVEITHGDGLGIDKDDLFSIIAYEY